MHKTMGLEPCFLCTWFFLWHAQTMGLEAWFCTRHGFYGCFLYILNMKRKYMKSTIYESSPSGKLNVFCLRGARFKTCLHPSSCTQIALDLRLTLHLAFLFQFSFCSYLQHANVRMWPSPLSYMCTLHLLDFVCSTWFSHRCRKSSRQRTLCLWS